VVPIVEVFVEIDPRFRNETTDGHRFTRIGNE
jgi:hypothetical protein